MAAPPTSFDDRTASSLLTGIEQPHTTHGAQNSDLETQLSPSDSNHGPSGREGTQEPSYNGSDTDQEPPAEGRSSHQKAAELASLEPKLLFWTEPRDDEHKQLCATGTIESCIQAQQMEINALKEMLALSNPGTAVLSFRLVNEAHGRCMNAAHQWRLGAEGRTQPRSRKEEADSFDEAGQIFSGYCAAIIAKIESLRDELVERSRRLEEMLKSSERHQITNS